MNYRDNGADRSRRSLPKNAQGVRGSVAYRKLSDSYTSEKNCPPALLFGVNTALVLLALLLLAVLVVFLTPIGDILAIGYQKIDISYTLELYDVDGTISTAPAVGTSLIDPATGEALGEITAVNTRPHEIVGVRWEDDWTTLPENAEPEEITLPVRVVTVTVSARALYRKDKGYRVGDLTLSEASIYPVSLGGTVARATCLTIEKRG